MKNEVFQIREKSFFKSIWQCVFLKKRKKYHQIWTFFDHKSTLSLNNFEDCIIFIFCKLKKTSKNMNFTFCKLKKLQKTWISFFASLKTSKNMNFIFCKLKKPQKTWISFFASLKNFKKYEFHFLQAKKKTQKTWISFFANLKKAQKTIFRLRLLFFTIHFLQRWRQISWQEERKEGQKQTASWIWAFRSLRRRVPTHRRRSGRSHRAALWIPRNARGRPWWI